MDTQLLQVPRAALSLELDLIADLACPWSFLAKRGLEKALERLYGAPVKVLRWHGLPLGAGTSLSWREHLVGRLPKGSTLESVEGGLRAAGEELGIAFRFEQLGSMPDTHEAHRLVGLAARAGRQSEVVDSLFSAFFEQGRNIGTHGEVAELLQDCRLDADLQAAFSDPDQGRGDVAAEEKRMRGLGIATVPTVLINGRVLVPGPADVDTYVQALDQALFPELPTAANRRRLH